MPKLATRTLSVSSALLTLGLLAACQTTPGTATTDDVCLIWDDITYSGSGDTSLTIEQVRELNARRDAYCGARK